MGRTEWDLQGDLQKSWARNGFCVGDDTFFLLGDEVMDNWRKNDPNKEWNSPSIDFLLADREGRVWALELKRGRLPPRAALELLCQVTMRSAKLQAGLSEGNLNAVHRWQYGHSDLHRSHQAFYGLPEPIATFAADNAIHRMVAAPELGEHVLGYLPLFEGRPLGDVRMEIEAEQYSRTRQFKKLYEFDDDLWGTGARTELTAIVLADDGTGKVVEAT